jgi:hypothetical protein
MTADKFCDGDGAERNYTSNITPLCKVMLLSEWWYGRQEAARHDQIWGNRIQEKILRQKCKKHVQ